MDVKGVAGLWRGILFIRVAALFQILILPIWSAASVHKIATWPEQESSYHNRVKVWGEKLVAANNGTLELYDISNPQEMRLISSKRLENEPLSDIEIFENHIYVLGDDHLRILEWDSKNQFIEIGAPIQIEDGEDLEIENGFLYVVSSEEGLGIFSLNTISAPELIGWVELERTGWAEAVSVDGFIAAVPQRSEGIEIFNVSDPTNVGRTGFNRHDRSEKVIVDAGRAFTLEGTYLPSDDGTIFTEYGQVIGPAHLSLRSRWPILAIQGDQLLTAGSLVSSRGESIIAIDISDPANPTIADFFRVRGFVNDIDISGNLASVALGDNGHLILDISDPANIELVSEFEVHSRTIGSIAVKDSILYSADGFGGLSILGIQPDGSLEFLAKERSMHSADGVTVEGDTAFVFDEKTLHIYDLSNPLNPNLISSLVIGDQLPSEPPQLTLIGELAYVGIDDSNRPGGEGSLLQIDISNPTSPVILNTITVNVSPKFTIGNDKIYFQENRTAVDIRDPKSLIKFNYESEVPDFPHGLRIDKWVTGPIGGPKFTVTIEVPIEPTVFHSLSFIQGVAFFIANPVPYGPESLVDPNAQFLKGKGLYVYDTTKSPWKLIAINEELFSVPANSYFEIFSNIAVVDTLWSFEVLDIADPTNMISIGNANTSITSGQVIQDIELVGNVVYLANGTIEAFHVDALDPIIDSEEDWLGFYFPKASQDQSLRESVWGDDADPDNDGYSNSMELLFGTHPKIHDAPSLAIKEIAGERYLEYSVSGIRSENAPRILKSNDLSNWEPLDETSVYMQNMANLEIRRVAIDENQSVFYRLAQASSSPH